ncbi:MULTISPECIES: hypothetical protein [Mesorhizobium]|nr:MULTISPECIES: hypothetical protein [Mesorhizobium]
METAVNPTDRLRFGTALSELSKEAGLTNADFGDLDVSQYNRPAEPTSFE